MMTVNEICWPAKTEIGLMVVAVKGALPVATSASALVVRQFALEIPAPVWSTHPARIVCTAEISPACVAVVWPANCRLSSFGNDIDKPAKQLLEGCALQYSPSRVDRDVTITQSVPAQVVGMPEKLSA